MGGRTRSYDWSKTSLGVPDQWPLSLRTTLPIILKARFPMFLFWGPEHLCFYNDAYRPILEREGEPLMALGRPGAEVWPAIWPTIEPLIDQALAGEETSWSDDQLSPSHGNGQPDMACRTYTYNSVIDELGQPVGVFVTGAESRGQVTRNQQLRHSKQRFQNLIRDISVGIIVLGGEDMRVHIVNQAYAQLINRSREALLNKPLFSIIPETESVFRPIIDEVRVTGNPRSLYNQPYFVHDGGERKEGFLNLVYQPYRELDGTISGVMVICQDVTEQMLAQQQIIASESKLRSVIESAPYPIAVYTGPQMRIQFANQSILDAWGRDKNVIGKPYAAVLPELATQGIYEQLNGVYTTGIAFHAQNQRVDIVVDGRLQSFYFKYSFTPLYDNDGQIYGVTNTGAEVTDLVVARQKQAEAEVSLRTAVELAQLATWSLDIRTSSLTYSERLMHWLGLSQPTKKLGNVYTLLPEEYRSSVADAIAAVIQPGSPGLYTNEHPIINQLTGQQRIIHVQAQVSYDSTTGEPVLLSGVAQDVTQQRRLQLTLEQQVMERTEELAAVNEELAATNEELASSNEEYASINEEYMSINEELTESTNQLIRSNENLQRFAYIASHDLQEPLRKIQSFGDLLRSGYADQLGEGVDYLTRMQASAGRMSTLIKDLLTFSRIATGQETRELVSLAQVVQQVLSDLDLIIAETGASVTVGDLPTVVGNPAQLSQLFTNMLSNALKFRRTDAEGVPVAAHVKISAQSVLERELPSSVKPSRSADWYHRIDVADDGVGFDEKYLDRIFQVFQRLHGKSEFAGTGIGLAICEKVTTNHGGAITATSQPGEGSTFSVYLPM